MSTGPVRGPAPVATYRVQLTPDHGFAEAAGACAAIAALGVSHLYLSPVLEAVPGSTHGYDVTDPTRVREELGGESGFEALVDAARAAGLGILVDIVPNHLAAAGRANPWWWALLREGVDGPAGAVFDVVGEPIAVPILGGPLEEVLAAGELVVDGDALRYFEHELPLRPDAPAEGPVAEVVARQHHRPVWWREPPGYRRFFDITSLVGVRVEDPDVFALTHQLPIRWCRSGQVDGLRIDHVDGLADPAGYLERLDAEVPGTWLLVEKILGEGEELPDAWPVGGTTGYEFAGLVDQLLVDPTGEAPMTEGYRELTGDPSTWEETAAEAKAEVAERLFSAELDRLAVLAGGFRDELARVVGSLDRYRTYVAPTGPPEAADRAILGLAGLPPELLGHRELLVRLQQVSGPVMAKGIEDTAMYRYLRLVSLNEVGGHPGTFGITVERFHQWCAAAAARPHRLLAGTTHDTKRSEDVRARLDLLAQVPDRWFDAVGRWRARAAFEDPHLEYLLWQTLVGAWPIDAGRLTAYLHKAAREAALRTSWRDPDERYEAAVGELVERVTGDGELLGDVEAFVEELRPAGRANSLAGALLRCTAPGVPDLYQGSEGEVLTLVDPDNRRPVPWGRSAGGDKARVITTALGVRRAHPVAFGAGGSYEPLSSAEGVLAYRRGEDVAVAVPLRMGVRAEAERPSGRWEDLLAGLPVSLWVRR